MAMGELRELRPADAGADGGRGDTLDELVGTEEVRYQLASPTFTGALSLFVWGLGQFYNGQMRAAKVFFAAQACLALYLYDFFSGGDVSTTVMSWTSPWVYGFFMTLLVGGGILVWLYNVYDAWATARFCHMIFDRTLPSLDDEEEELLAAHLRTTTFGVEHHRGAGRKMAYGALAVLAYSAVLFMLGSYFNGVGRGDLTALRIRLEANPTDAFSHLQLGELLMADGRYAEAVHAFNQVVRHSQDPSWSMVAYGNLARLYRRLGDDERAKDMLTRAATLGAATAVAAAPAGSEQVPSSAGPGDAAQDAPNPDGASVTAVDAQPVGDTNTATLAFALETARADLDAGALDGALATLNGLEARGIEAPSALALKARVHLARGDVAAAKACVDAALADDTGSEDVQGARLDLACAEGDPGAVSAAWEGYRSAGGGDPARAARAASVLNGAGRNEAAYQLVAEALASAPRQPELLNLAFILARDAGNEAQAYEAALALVEAQVRDVAAYSFLADGAARRGDLDGAVKYARGLTVQEPGTARWLVLLGDLEGRRGAVAEATTAYRNALVLDDRQVEVYRKLAALASGSKAWNDAALYLNRAIALAPSDVGLLKDLADVHRRRGALDEALTALDAARRLDPQDLDLKYSTGVVRFERDDAAAAAGLLGEVFAVAPSYREVAWYFGRCCEREGRRDEARRAYAAVRPGSEFAAEAARRVEALTPPAPTPTLTASVAEGTGSVSPPLATAGTASFVPVERYADLLRRAELAVREDRFEEALGLYDQVLALVPTHARSLYQRGVVLRQLGRTDEAVTTLQAARRARPDDMTVLIELGNLLADLGRLDEATEAFETAVRIDPKHLAARYTLGWLFEKRGSYAKAEEHYKAIAWFYPEYVKAYEYLGNVYFVQARYAEALTNFDKILALDPDDAAVRFKAALTLLNINDVDRARRELIFLKGALGPEHPLRAKVVQYLAKLG